MCVQYIRGCSVHWGCSVHQGIPWVHWGISWVRQGDTMSTSGVFSTSGGYHDACGGIPWVHQGISWCMWGITWVHRGMFSTSGDVQYIGVFTRNWKVFTNLLPYMHHDIPRCTEHPPVYSWCPPMYSWYPPNVLNIPWCTHDIPHIHHDIPQCTEHPQCTHDIPRCTHGIPRCTEHTLYRVLISMTETIQSTLDNKKYSFGVFIDLKRALTQ